MRAMENTFDPVIHIESHHSIVNFSFFLFTRGWECSILIDFADGLTSRSEA